MANSQMLVVAVFLAIFTARSHTKDIKDKDIVSHQNQEAAIGKLTDSREQIFLVGSNATLWCAEYVTDLEWNELIFIVWNISIQGKKCWLGLSPKLDNTCNDGKTLFNTSDGVNLFIPKITMEDEGFYLCDLSYRGGSKSVNISVIVTRLETQLDSKNGRRIAVCKATYKNKTPTLHWEPALSFSSNATVKTFDKFVIMEIRAHLPDNMTISNVTCVASYPSMSGPLQQNSTLDLTTQDISNTGKSLSEIIAISSGPVILILVFLAAVFYVLRRKLKHVSALKTLCCKSKISPPAEDKPPQPADVEEVEPYASYIQRVNSIYNSSAELFNA